MPVDSKGRGAHAGDVAIAHNFNPGRRGEGDEKAHADGEIPLLYPGMGIEDHHGHVRGCHELRTNYFPAV